MKQGKASVKHVAGQHNIPPAHAVSVGAVDQLGQSTHFKKEELYKGRGYEAPMKGTEIHHCGSQGKH